MRKDSKRSSCWKYFEKLEGRAKCLTCKKEIACFGNTSNLHKHMRRIHKIVPGEDDHKQRNGKDSECNEENEPEGVPAEEQTEAVVETNAAVHTIQAYRDVNGTTFLYLQPQAEGETSVHVQNAQFQPVVATSESIASNGEIVSVAVQKDSVAVEGQAVDGDAKTQEETTVRRLVHVPVKNHQGSAVASRAVVRQLNRPSPVKSAPPSNSDNNSNGYKEDSFDAFGRYIASLLRNLPAKSACKVQGEIVNWILKEQMKA